MLRSLSVAAAAVMLVFSMTWSAHAQEARFELSVSWTEPGIDYGPKRQTRIFRLTLGERGKVTEQVWRGRGANPLRGGRTKNTGALGEDIDDPISARWKVVNDRTLVRLIAERSHTFAIWLTHEGSGSCTARLEWRLKPGFKVYERRLVFRGGTVRFGQPVVEYATCKAY